ncbi:hypothetical protein [Xylophilus sp. GOD-11R]|uniref:hypothetical protein n=1 Tax=Xylophilus sp. GOD-11R TaxID=3089814 RepID=UPI00298D16C7|nr:hypothetical protein [Xylophilus sp. GOD-11R]WPB58653.1 hypothetical protein R9X41_08455 [Xylophilus sp. GOD-11R]
MMLGMYPAAGEPTQPPDHMAARLADLHIVLRIALALGLGGVMWNAYKGGALTLFSEQTMVYQAARQAGWPHGIVWLFALGLVLPIPRLVAVIGWPHWRFNRVSAKVAVFGAYFNALGSAGLAYGSIPFKDTALTLQFMGNGLFSIVAGFLIGVILNTDLKWERLE